MQQLDILILGAGWTSTFLIPLLKTKNFNFAATTKDGREVASHKTIKWSFNPDGDSDSDLGTLPLAQHVLVTFPLTSAAQTDFLVSKYIATHRPHAADTRFIQLGSTGIWQIPQKQQWVSRHSPYNTTNPRAIAEDALLKHNGCVLNLAGLWGGEREPRTWVDRVATTKEAVRSKKSLHMIHGLDVSRAIIAVMGNWYSAKGERWMLTDGFVYDWWALFAGWADTKAQNGQGDETVDSEPSKQAKWVYECMLEEKVWALPRSMGALERCYFGREFWDTFQLAPVKARI
ncbi:hypothetical protein B0A48_08589 [Cryoendolithus antarcticus]|uniref:Uncharacterized protein n=1 Tax=Cryoendolithus antarcticus TaxID=1507870 RepID=A0A1V8T6B6_9PEZI|nr:hypothetical protein B0A48_08589 [Cryoendolithus antarcticus]